jgi:DNA-directed RNA polymerase subunit RPC12/RpoP
MTRLTAEDRAARRADHEAGSHADLDLFVFGCPPCEAEEEARHGARLKAQRQAEREGAMVRAAWLASSPDAIAWRCVSCGAELTNAEADQGQGPLYDCGSCGSTFSRARSANRDSNRCPDCNHFGAKVAELACAECGEGELEPVGPAA